MGEGSRRDVHCPGGTQRSGTKRRRFAGGGDAGGEVKASDEEGKLGEEDRVVLAAGCPK